eukprot:scaffold14238_cov71-Phaeocystis_antarctica.AAC.2
MLDSCVVFLGQRTATSEMTETMLSLCWLDIPHSGPNQQPPLIVWIGVLPDDVVHSEPRFSVITHKLPRHAAGHTLSARATTPAYSHTA